MTFCDLDSGACEPTADAPGCTGNADCAYFYGGAFCEPDAGGCVQCAADADCVAIGYASTGYSYCVAGSCYPSCAEDQDCGGNPAGPHCVTGQSANHCGCAHDADCAGNVNGLRCQTDTGNCGCADASDCSPGLSCYSASGSCTPYCSSDLDCPAQFFCSELSTCLPRCDDGGAGCQAPFLACDLNDVEGGNGSGVFGQSVPGAVWCYQCISGNDCPPGQACTTATCNSQVCAGEGSCHTGEVCGIDELCHASCDAGACPAGQVCDTGNAVGNVDLCYQCLSPVDCPAGEGCDSRTHLCGSCRGPTAAAPSVDDCPPDAICSIYWGTSHSLTGACLQNCDVFACPDPTDICAVFPQLTPDHRYCFGCLQDSDCADAGAGAHCDNSLGLTFTCKLPPAP